MGYRDIVKWDREWEKEYLEGVDGMELGEWRMGKYGVGVGLGVGLGEGWEYNYVMGRKE